MGSGILDFTLNLTHDVANVTDRTATANNISYHQQTSALNDSFRENCIRIVFSEMEYLPWDNPDNIISAEVESLVGQIKNNVMFLLFLIGGPANVINMVVFSKQGLKDRVNLCLFTLSLFDGLHLITSMLIHGEQLYLQFTTKQRFGPIVIFITNNYLMMFSSVYFISPILSAIIATERCLCVFNPLKFQALLRTRTMAVIIVLVIIVVQALVFILVLRFRLGCAYDPESGVTVTTAVYGEFYLAHQEFIDSLDSLVFGVGLPGVTMIVVITTTILTVVKLRQIVLWRAGASSTVSSREVALTRMLVGNSILFLACTSPIALIRFSWLFFPDMNSAGRNQNFFLAGIWILEMFTYINATFNIVIYYIMGSRYRETFWALFGRKAQREKP